LDVLHDEVGRVVLRVEADRLDDVRVVELVLELGLLLEAVHGLGARGDLDGDELAGDLGVLGLPHLAEAALAQLLEQGVLRDSVALVDRPITHNVSWQGALTRRHLYFITPGAARPLRIIKRRLTEVLSSLHYL